MLLKKITLIIVDYQVNYIFDAEISTLHESNEIVPKILLRNYVTH